MLENNKKILINFKKAKSLIAKIEKMTEEKEYCVDIMQQNLAAIGLLKKAQEMLMEKHLNTCFKNAMAARDEKLKKKMTEEILRVVKLSSK